MPLEGLRAWIGEVERKLGVRTKIGLVLLALAIGAAGAGIYLALDAASNSIDKKDLKSLEEQVGQPAAIGAPEAGPEVGALQAEVTQLQGQLSALEEEVEALQSGGKPAAGQAPEGGDKSGPEEGK
ncbi:MAG TPA: hypothetical protein VG518_05940 [Solirubrobacterales bacterium]|nr:hypothetical protein [Solirubrobacterales bacterium]